MESNGYINATQNNLQKVAAIVLTICLVAQLVDCFAAYLIDPGGFMMANKITLFLDGVLLIIFFCFSSKKTNEDLLLFYVKIFILFSCNLILAYLSFVSRSDVFHAMVGFYGFVLALLSIQNIRIILGRELKERNLPVGRLILSSNRHPLIEYPIAVACITLPGVLAIHGVLSVSQFVSLMVFLFSGVFSSQYLIYMFFLFIIKRSRSMGNSPGNS